MRTTPEPTPVAGTSKGESPRRASVSEVIVTTDGVVAATTAVMSVGPLLTVEPAGTALAVAGAVGAPGPAFEATPATMTAVEPDASTAESSETARIEPRRPGRRDAGRRVGVAAGGGTAVGVADARGIAAAGTATGAMGYRSSVIAGTPVVSSWASVRYDHGSPAT